MGTSLPLENWFLITVQMTCGGSCRWHRCFVGFNKSHQLGGCRLDQLTRCCFQLLLGPWKHPGPWTRRLNSANSWLLDCQPVNSLIWASVFPSLKWALSSQSYSTVAKIYMKQWPWKTHKNTVITVTVIVGQKGKRLIGLGEEYQASLFSRKYQRILLCP